MQSGVATQHGWAGVQCQCWSRSPSCTMPEPDQLTCKHRQPCAPAATRSRQCAGMYGPFSRARPAASTRNAVVTGPATCMGCRCCQTTLHGALPWSLAGWLAAGQPEGGRWGLGTDGIPLLVRLSPSCILTQPFTPTLPFYNEGVRPMWAQGSDTGASREKGSGSPSHLSWERCSRPPWNAPSARGWLWGSG